VDERNEILMAVATHHVGQKITQALSQICEAGQALAESREIVRKVGLEDKFEVSAITQTVVRLADALDSVLDIFSMGEYPELDDERETLKEAATELRKRALNG
jgi:hypothetical protein